MALLFLDSFDHYSTSQNSRKWTIAGSNAHPTGRTNNGVEVSGGSTMLKTLMEEYVSVTAGGAYKTAGFANAIFTISNVARGNVPTVKLDHVGDGRLRMNIGNTNTTPFSNFTVNTNEWYFVELNATIAAVGGTGTDSSNVKTAYTVRVNNNQIANGTVTNSGDYYGTGSGNLNYANVKIEGPGGGLTAIHDDLYISDGEFLGDIRVYVLRPNDNHATSDWAQGGTSTGTNDYNFINDTNPNDDTGYLLSTATNQVQFTEMEDITGFSGSIKGAQAVWCMEKSDGGEGIFQGLLLDGTGTGGTHTSSIWYPSYASYLFFHKGYSTSPFTGTSWTETEIDAIKQGEKRTG